MLSGGKRLPPHAADCGAGTVGSIPAPTRPGGLNPLELRMNTAMNMMPMNMMPMQMPIGMNGMQMPMNMMPMNPMMMGGMPQMMNGMMPQMMGMMPMPMMMCEMTCTMTATGMMCEMKPAAGMDQAMFMEACKRMMTMMQSGMPTMMACGGMMMMCTMAD
jgi:hypothetical protein